MSNAILKPDEDVTIKNDLFKRWEYIMNLTWNFLLDYKKQVPTVNLYLEEQTIFFNSLEGNEYQIKCCFINSKFLQLQINITGLEDFEASITYIDKLTDEGIIKIIASILTFTQKINYDEFFG